MVKKKAALKCTQVFERIREGNSLYAACVAADMTTKDFYETMSGDASIRRAYQLALSDYADRCTDDIRKIVKDLKAGEIDNSTAKLLIETEKWLAQKVCPEPLWSKEGQGSAEAMQAAEIVVRFVE